MDDLDKLALEIGDKVRCIKADNALTTCATPLWTGHKPCLSPVNTAREIR
jgi:hypothetical protein